MKLNKQLIIKTSLLSLMFVVGIFFSTTGVSAQTTTSKQKMTPSKSMTTVTMDSARKTALRHASGTVEREEMETQNGKSVYAFDIRSSKGATREVWIDATNGHLIRNSKKSSGTTEQNKVAYSKKKTKH